ncbi:rRNA accumulation- protein [Blastocladiella emersonii ATCC 22665]|nr:rRNA accumulation- protein [Blastocladiella emersonii ATCC 22665]
MAMNSAHAQQLHDGVTLLLSNWFALRTAVEQGWGGHESEDKAKWFMNTVAEYLVDEGHKIDVDDIADVLDDVMSEEFKTILEDNSGYEMGKVLYLMYKDCAAGNYARVDALRKQFPNTRLPTASRAAQADSDSDDSGSDGEDEPAPLTAPPAGEDGMQVDGTEAEPQRRGPVVDEDGFQMVGRRGRGRK